MLEIAFDRSVAMLVDRRDRADDIHDERKIDDWRNDCKKELEHDGLRKTDEGKARRFSSRNDPLVLPDALDGPERPSEALTSKLSERPWSFGPGDRALVVGNLPARALDCDREVLVFRKGLAGITSDFDNCFPTPGSHCARDHGHCAKSGKGAPLDVLGRNIFKRLPFGRKVDPVSNFGVSRNSCKFRIGDKPARKPSDRIGFELRIGIQCNH